MIVGLALGTALLAGGCVAGYIFRDSLLELYLKFVVKA
jgi:hypothetical protein